MFQIPQSREEFMLFVQQVAREDVKKCLAGVSTTHPELIQQFLGPPIQQTPSSILHHNPFPSSSIQQVTINDQPSSSGSSPPSKLTSYSAPTTNVVRGNSNSQPTENKTNNLNNTHSNNTPSNSNHHVNVNNKSTSPNTKQTTFSTSPNTKSKLPATPIKSEKKEKTPSPNNEKVIKSPGTKQPIISERLLKPTISMQKKFEKEQVKKKTDEKEFKELRKEQKKSTSLLLKKKPTRKEVKKPENTPKQNISKTDSNETNNTAIEHDNGEDESNIDQNDSQHESPHELAENDVDISNISSEPSVAFQSSEIHSTPEKSQPSSAHSSPKNQASQVSSSPPPTISPKRETGQPIITNQLKSVKSDESEKSKVSIHTQYHPELSSNGVENSKEPGKAPISCNHHSNNPQYDKLEEKLLDEMLKEFLREEHYVNKKRAEQEIKVIEKNSQQHDKYDEIFRLLTQLEQDEISIRKRYNNKNYLLDSTMESETSETTSEEADESYQGLDIETMKIIQKYKRRNRKYFEAFCRPHDLSIDTLMQV